MRRIDWRVLRFFARMWWRFYRIARRHGKGRRESARFATSSVDALAMLVVTYADLEKAAKAAEQTASREL